jgi:hypothetical protein
VSYIGLAAQAVLLSTYTAGAQGWTIAVMAVVFALAAAFRLCSTAFHVSRLMVRGREGRDLAWLEVLTLVAVWGVSVACWIVAVARGKEWLGVASALLAIAAIVPVWHGDKLGNGRRTASSVRFRSHAPWRDLVACFGWNFQSGVGFWAWSMYLAIVIPSFRILGVIAAISSIAMGILTMLAGRWIDRHHKGVRVVLVATVCLGSVVHLLRIGVAVVSDRLAAAPMVATVVLTLSTIVYGVVASLLQVSWQKSYYSWASEQDINYVASMESSAMFSQLVLWSGLCALAYFGQSANVVFVTAFAYAGVVTGCCVLIRRHSGQMSHDQADTLLTKSK